MPAIMQKQKHLSPGGCPGPIRMLISAIAPCFQMQYTYNFPHPAKAQAGPASISALPAHDHIVLLKLFVTLQMVTTSRALGKQQAASPAHPAVSVLPTVAPAAPVPSTNLLAQPQGPLSATPQSVPEASSPFQDSFEAISARAVQPSDPQASAHDVSEPSPDTPPAGATCEGWVAFGLQGRLRLTGRGRHGFPRLMPCSHVPGHHPRP